jgi:NADH dehydrogenase
MQVNLPSYGAKKIMLLGGTGFVGRALAGALSRAGFFVTLPSRHAQRHRDLALNPRIHLIDCKQAASDIATQRASLSWSEMMAGHSVLINLVGILNEPKHNGVGFEQAHVALTQTALKAAREAGVARYLHMSALGADADKGSSFYLKSKGRAEDWAHVFGEQNGIAVTSFRPSVIFGPQDSFLNRFVALAALMPGVFPLACAEARFAPVFVGDVVAQFMSAIENPGHVGQRIELCGPADYTLRELVAYAAKTAGHPRLIIGLPDWASRLQARLLELAPGKPFTRDNYASLQTPSVCAAGCPRQPTRLETVAPHYLAE